MSEVKSIDQQLKSLRARRDVRDDSANNGWRTVNAPASEVEAAATIERLRAALEGLHFHHKMFEPDCRKCCEALAEVMPTSDELRCPVCGSDSPSHIQQDDDGPCREPLPLSAFRRGAP